MGYSEAEEIPRFSHQVEACNDIIGIITARGGSKGLPRKNISDLNGKPLIVYTIEAVLKCKLIKRCIVTTDDPEIKKISIENGAEVIDRPHHLATDTALSKDVVEHVLTSLDEKGELTKCFALFQPTSPLRNEHHITECIKLYEENMVNSVISVTEVEHHPYKSFYLKDNVLSPVFGYQDLDKPRQKLPTIYRHNGAIYLINSELFLKNKTFFIEPITPYIMSAADSADIDTIEDFNRVADELKIRGLK